MNARIEARRVILLVEVNNGEATLRSASELQPTGPLRMPIPYREYCSYSFANGKFFSFAIVGCPAVMSVGLTLWR